MYTREITGDQQLVEWTNILSKIKLQTDNQNKINKNPPGISQQETTKDTEMSKVFKTILIYYLKIKSLI
jgi:hypothetical protein